MLGYTFAVNCTVTRTSIKKLFWACSEWYWISHACSAVLLPAKHNSNKKIFLERPSAEQSMAHLYVLKKFKDAYRNGGV